MKLFNFKYVYDYSHDVYLQFFSTKNWSLLQLCFCWADFPSAPYVQITMGSNGLFGSIVYLYRFGFDISILSRKWNWDYLEDIEV